MVPTPRGTLSVSPHTTSMRSSGIPVASLAIIANAVWCP